MPIQPIDIGSNPDDYTGDALRTAFDKVNQNDTALNAEKASHGNVSTAVAAHDVLTKHLPVGGTTGQRLVKASATDYDAIWQTQQVSATARILGRFSPGAGDLEELTGTQATTLLDVFTSGLKGLAPASGGGTTNYLRADGSWAEPPGTAGSGTDVQVDTGGVLAAADFQDGGDINFAEAAGVVTATVKPSSVTYAKIQNVTQTDVFLGRDTVGAGVIEEITAAAARTILNVADGANNYSHPNHTGDVTSVGDGAQTIANNAVTHAKYQNIATARILGRVTAATGDPEELTGTQATTLLDVFTSGLKGLAPASGGGTTNFLRADGSWAAPPGGGGGTDVQVDTGGVLAAADFQDGGDINFAEAAGVVTATVKPSSVTYAKIQNVTQTDVFLGRDTIGAGVIEEISAAAARTILNVADGANNYSHPNHTGDVTSVGDGAQTIADNAVTNAKAADMAAWTYKVRNAGTSGDPSDAALAGFTEELTPGAGDMLVGFLSTGEIRKFDVGNLPTGGGGEANLGANVTDGGGIGVFRDKTGVTLNFHSLLPESGVTTVTDTGNDLTLGVAANGISNAKLADMATDTIKMRNTAATGDPEDVKVSALTEEPAPAAGDWILGETAEGDLVKYDVGDLPGGGSNNASDLVWAGGTQSEIADGASAIAFDFDTDNSYATAGAKLLSLKNNTAEQVAFFHQGDMVVRSSAHAFDFVFGSTNGDNGKFNFRFNTNATAKGGGTLGASFTRGSFEDSAAVQGLSFSALQATAFPSDGNTAYFRGGGARGNADTAHSGGDAILRGGHGLSTATTAAANGGDSILTGGLAYGTGVAGKTVFADAVDNTKEMAHDVSGITTATRRTATWPDTDVNLGIFNSSTTGMVPASGGSATDFLCADGTWKAAGGGSNNASDLVWAGGTQSEIADGASAIAFDFDTDNSYATAGAKLLSLKNNTVEKLNVSKDGELHLNFGSTRATLDITSDPGSGGDPIISTQDQWLILAGDTGGTSNPTVNSVPCVFQLSWSEIQLWTANKNRIWAFREFAAASGGQQFSSSAWDRETTIQGHTRLVDEARQDFFIRGGPQWISSVTNLVGGKLRLVGGAGASGSAGNAHGGDLTLAGGLAYGTGTDGLIVFQDGGDATKELAHDVSGITTATRRTATWPDTDVNLGIFGSAISGMVPASGGSATDFLCADGTWKAPAGGSNNASDLVWAGGTQSEIADGASAIAFDFDTDNSYATAGAKLLSLKNNTAEKLSVDKDGKIVGSFAQNFVDFSTSEAKLSGQGNIRLMVNTANAFVAYGVGSSGVAATCVSLDPGDTTRSIFGGDYGHKVVFGNRSLVSDVTTADIFVHPGAAFSSAATNIVGANVYVSGGAGASGSAGNAHGGDAIFRGGLAYGTGTDGAIVFADASDNTKELAHDVSGITTATRRTATWPDTDVNLGIFGSAVSGMVPASGGGTTNFLRADGSWAAPAGGSNNASDLVWAGGTQSEIADGASAIAFDFDTDNSYATAGAKLLSLKNNTVEKAYIDKDGDIFSASGYLYLNTTNQWIRGFPSQLQFGVNSSSAIATLSPASFQVIGTTDFVVEAPFNATSGFQRTFTVKARDRQTNTGAGHLLVLSGGAGSTDTTGSAGGSTTVRGGQANGTGDNNGGDVLLFGGADTGAGTPGRVVFADALDNTKELAHDVSGITTATRRTATWPDTDVNLGIFNSSTTGMVPASGGSATDFLCADGTWKAPAGGGDVTAAANIADNAIVRGDGGAKGVQQSGITIDDTDKVAGIVELRFTESGNRNIIQATATSDAAQGILSILGGDAFSTAVTNLKGGGLDLLAGDGASAANGPGGDTRVVGGRGYGTANGGNVLLAGGAEQGTGTDGYVQFVAAQDLSKGVQHDVSGITAATMRTATWPDADINFGSLGTANLADEAVTYAKMQHMTTDRLLGRDTAATGDVEEISLNATLEFTGAGAIQRAALTGDVTASAGSNSTTVISASDRTAGKVELAIASEVNTGTDATRAITPDSLAGSNLGTKTASIMVTDGSGAITTGNGKGYLRIGPEFNGMNLVSVGAALTAPSTSGAPNIQIARGRQASPTAAHTFVDTLSTALTIDQDEYDSKDATTAAVINTANDDVATGDLIRVDVDGVGSGPTAVLIVTLGFRLP